MTREGKYYFVTFIDDCSRYTCIFIKSNRWALSKCKSVTEIENKLNQVVKFISDQGGKYTSKSFTEFCDLYA